MLSRAIMSNRTFVLIKPDGVQQKVIGKILSRFEEKGFTIVNLKMLTPSKELVAEHYAEHNGKSFFERIIDYVSSGPTVAMVLEGEDQCYKTVREMIGSTRPEDAAKGTIRGDYGTKAPYNVIHGSDSVESANREISLWFGN